MATIPPILIYRGPGAVEISWASLRIGDIGSAAALAEYPNKTLSVRGVFGVGGLIHIVGSDSFDLAPVTSWNPLCDSRGVGYYLSLTAVGHRRINENPARIGCFIGAGDANTLLIVAILCSM